MRKNDELVLLANGINRVLDTVKDTVKGETSKLEKAYLSLENLRRIADDKPINHSMLTSAVDKLSEELREVSKELEKYKV